MKPLPRSEHFDDWPLQDGLQAPSPCIHVEHQPVLLSLAHKCPQHEGFMTVVASNSFSLLQAYAPTFCPKALASVTALIWYIFFLFFHPNPVYFQWTVQTPPLSFPWEGLSVISFLWKTLNHTLILSFLYQLSNIINFCQILLSSFSYTSGMQWWSFELIYWVITRCSRFPQNDQTPNIDSSWKSEKRKKKINYSH